MASFIIGMKNFFGLKQGQGTMEFGREVMGLSYEERVEFHKMLVTQAGFEDVDPPSPPIVKK